MEWVFLSIAILFEIAGTVCLKLSDGFSRLVPSLVIFPAYAVSFTFLAMAVKVLPISVAYAVWSGVGTAVIALVGVVWLREPANIAKLVCIAMVIAGVVGLHLVERAGGPE